METEYLFVCCRMVLWWKQTWGPFNSVPWSFLFEVLGKLSFGELWLHRIFFILSSPSTKVTINGVPGRQICHCLQPEAWRTRLTSALWHNHGIGVESCGRGPFLCPTCNLYFTASTYLCSDVVLFVRPWEQDLSAVRQILTLFGEASGLQVKYQKTSATLIRGDDKDEAAVMEHLHCPLAKFPVHYLGLQLALRPLTKAEWWLMLDNVLSFQHGRGG